MEVYVRLYSKHFYCLLFRINLILKTLRRTTIDIASVLRSS